MVRFFRYDEAAELRERLREVKEEADAVVGRRSLAAESVEPRRFRLGQRVTHAVHGYRGVVCGRAPQVSRLRDPQVALRVCCCLQQSVINGFWLES